MQPPAEHVHRMFATGFLVLGLCLLAEAIVGPEVWGKRRWRAGQPLGSRSILFQYPDAARRAQY